MQPSFESCSNASLPQIQSSSCQEKCFVYIVTLSNRNSERREIEIESKNERDLLDLRQRNPEVTRNYITVNTSFRCTDIDPTYKKTIYQTQVMLLDERE